MKRMESENKKMAEENERMRQRMETRKKVRTALPKGLEVNGLVADLYSAISINLQ